LSPTETPSELEEKLRDYRTAGTRLVWVVDPATRIVSVRAENGDASLLREGDELDGGDVLPGFVLAIIQVFARLAK
jgi:Uma2 family endonuclease